MQFLLKLMNLLFPPQPVPLTTLSPYPFRPMNNDERKAVWQMKYSQLSSLDLPLNNGGSSAMMTPSVPNFSDFE
jgi:hypothetical protein